MGTTLETKLLGSGDDIGDLAAGDQANCCRLSSGLELTLESGWPGSGDDVIDLMKGTKHDLAD